MLQWYKNLPYIEFPIIVPRVGDKASLKIKTDDNFFEKKSQVRFENFRKDMREIHSVVAAQNQKIKRDFINLNQTTKKETLNLTTKPIQETDISEKLKIELEILIPHKKNKTQTIFVRNDNVNLLELFIRSQNLINTYLPYGGFEKIYGEGSLKELERILLSEYEIADPSLTNDPEKILELKEILKQMPSELSSLKNAI